MDYSAANTALWGYIIQLGIIAGVLLLSTFLCRKIPFIRNSLLPTAVLGGLILFLLRHLGILEMDVEFLEMLVYHCIALGFIAMSLRVTAKGQRDTANMAGSKSGALIVGTYLIQGIVGLIITLGLAYTFMPDMFKAAGLLLPMGYGQGPGQANNIGSSYEALGFVGGRSFGLAIAAAGYLCACIVGVIVLNVLSRRGKVGRQRRESVSGSVTVDNFQDAGEIPISESIDKFSVQIAMVLLIYLVTYLVTWGITAGLSAAAPGLANTVNSLLWGFNFIIGSALAILFKVILQGAKKANFMTRQYQNNYLLSRISGFFFDLMIVAGIASINLEELTGLWVPFLLMAVAGGIITWYYLAWACKRIYKGYYYEGLFSMYGMLTGTISSGILLLREIDPDYETPAANNLVLGSSFGIIFGAPMLVLVGLAAESTLMCFVTLGLCIIYFTLLNLFICKAHRNPNRKKKTEK